MGVREEEWVRAEAVEAEVLGLLEEAEGGADVVCWRSAGPWDGRLLEDRAHLALAEALEAFVGGGQ
jgi:hypothetical protein